MVVAGKLLEHYKLTLKEPVVNVQQHDEDISEHPLDNLDDLLHMDIEDRSLGYDTESYIMIITTNTSKTLIYLLAQYY